MDPNNPPTNPPSGRSSASGDPYGQRPSWEQQYGQPSTGAQPAAGPGARGELTGTPQTPAQPPYGQPNNQPYGQPPQPGSYGQPGQPYPPQGYAPGQPGQPRGPQPGGPPYPAGGPPAAFDHTLVTAAFELPGHTIVRNFGMVRGIIVRSRSIFGQIGAGFQQLAGGNISIYTEMCERARQDAYEIMIQHAAQIRCQRDHLCALRCDGAHPRGDRGALLRHRRRCGAQAVDSYYRPVKRA